MKNSKRLKLMKLETKLKRKQNSNKKKVEDSNPANTFVEAAYKQGDDLEKHSKELIIEMQKSGKKFIQSTTSDQFQPPKNRKTRSVNNEALHTFPTLSFSPLRLNSKPLPKSTSKSSKKPSLKASKTPPQKPPKKSTSKSSKKPSLKASKTPPQKPPKKSFSKAPNKLRSYKNQQQDQKDPSPHNIKGCKTLKKSKNAPKKNHKISPAKKTLKRRKTDEDAEEKIPTNTPKKKSQSPNKETGEGKPKRKRRLKAKLEMDRFAINQADGGIDEDLFKQMFNSLIQDKNGNPQQKFEGLTPENCHEDLKELIWCIFQKYSGEADNTKNGIFGILISCALLLIRENDSPARISELLKGDNDLAVKSKKKYFIHLKSFIKDCSLQGKLSNILLGENPFTEKSELVPDMDGIFYDSVKLYQFHKAFDKMCIENSEESDKIYFIFLMICYTIMPMSSIVRLKRSDFFITDSDKKLLVIEYEDSLNKNKRKSVICNRIIKNQICKIITKKETYLILPEKQLETEESTFTTKSKKLINKLSNKLNQRFQTFTKHLINPEGCQGITPKAYREISKYLFNVGNTTPQELEKITNCTLKKLSSALGIKINIPKTVNLNELIISEELQEVPYEQPL